MPSPTVENYLKKIYLEQQQSVGDLVSMGRLASTVGVVPGTATAMIKALADSGLVSYEPRSGVRLTRGGEQLALHVLRRHRLVELFLVKVLGLDWSEVHAEAEELEHAISDKVLDKIDALLGHPSVDPHGDPIPTARGDVVASPVKSLANGPLGRPLRVARIIDQEPAFLQFVNRCGLVPGVAVIIDSRDDVAQTVVVRDQRQHATTLGAHVAAKILVEENGE
jgi:DtxR family Mn-dependent transcriptional regulator